MNTTYQGSAVRWLSLIMLFISSCSGQAASLDALPTGVIERGAEWFVQSINGAPSCVSCHSLDGTTLVGPSLQGYGDVAGSRVEGLSAEEYTYNSILRPAEHLALGFANVMYNQYGRRLSEQQIADLIAYLLSLTT